MPVYRRKRFGRSKAERRHDMMVNVAAVMVLLLLAASAYKTVTRRSVSAKLSDIAAFRAPAQAVMLLRDLAEADRTDFAEVLAVYLIDNAFFKKVGEPHSEAALEAAYIAKHGKLKSVYGEETVAPYADLCRLLMEEIECFPVSGDGIMYGDSFGAAGRAGAYTGIDVYDKERVPGRLRVMAMAKGTVREVGRNAQDGCFVVVESDAGTLYRYMHLAYVSADVYAGGRVFAGMALGYMGDTGTNGQNDLFPVRLSVSVQVNHDLLGGQAYINPYIFLSLVENAEQR